MLAIRSNPPHPISLMCLDLSVFRKIKWWANFVFVSYDVRVEFRTNDDELLSLLIDYLPPGWQSASLAAEADLYYFLVATSVDDRGTVYQLFRGVEKIAEAGQLQDVYEVFGFDLRRQVGILAKDYLFVHADMVC